VIPTENSIKRGTFYSGHPAYHHPNGNTLCLE